ncbi:carbohydrate-binding protein SusD [Arachidicoccus ginsenosidimutans]|uniref:RagB/SusD family nutrient uptake outer membrane protein n=1 Tax=Arachidicoccus sp. BS20 TaxID=1850526 RepID=UPI0007F0D6A6|nr:RagB/SusD family nutrient uptake outer membrane protein [Arachidicoccus sp. BS20]ANI89086.1 carbohydrate-binding protein SusD [Arachidicoccus sp. BS20]
MKRYYIFLFGLLFTVSSCKKYLDVVPDNVATIDDAFTLRSEAEKYLATCYSYLPDDGNPEHNVGFLGADEIWFPSEYREYDATIYSWEIARGNQSVSDPYVNTWDGAYYGKYMFGAIRNCNIFLDNISDLSKVPDLGLDERKRWIAEAKFLKAYYHYILLRMYGPIPITDKNIDVSAEPEDVKVKRQTFDSCVNYIANLLDTAAAGLPAIISNQTTELGRATSVIAKAVKAKLLVLAASPLFNGNPDYANFKNSDGTNLFDASADATKWQRAADACKDAIDAAESAGLKLYTFPTTAFNLSSQTMTEMSIRQAVCDRWNDEEVWGLSNSLTASLQQACMARVSSDLATNTNFRGMFSATMKMAEMFYSKNGVPISEDKTLDFSNKYSLRTAVDSERFDISSGYTTARLNFDREPRFYADMCFDGGVWYLYNSPTASDSGTYVLQAKSTQYGGSDIGGGINATGYFIKKFVDWNISFTESGVTYRNYEWHEIRLADLYLLYAEALNESSGPSDEVYTYLNKIRERAGIPSIQDAWTKYSKNPTEYQTQAGLRNIIKQERGIELAFEGSRFWDLRRWKDAADALNAPVQGWTVNEGDAEDYYQKRTLYVQEFQSPRDYLWPIKQYDLLVNSNLVQNPGW